MLFWSQLSFVLSPLHSPVALTRLPDQFISPDSLTSFPYQLPSPTSPVALPSLTFVPPPCFLHSPPSSLLPPPCSLLPHPLLPDRFRCVPYASQFPMPPRCLLDASQMPLAHLLRTSLICCVPRSFQNMKCMILGTRATCTYVYIYTQ